MQCPTCQSDQVQRLEVIYDSGTRNIHATSHTTGFGLGSSVGAGGLRTSASGTEQTTLAAKLAPPAKKGSPAMMVIVTIGLSFVAFGVSLPRGEGFVGTTFALIVAAIVLYLGIKRATSVSKFNNEQWPVLYRQWKKSWFCHKCGTVYEDR